MSDEALDNPAPDAGPSDTPQPDSIINTPEPSPNDAPAAWRDDWRQEMSGGDDKYLKQLERLNSPMDLAKSYKELQTKFSSQPVVVEKPNADSTPEQLAAYRESIGMPEEASGYNLDFEDGTVIGEDIRPQLDGFLEYAHGSNMAPDDVKSTVGWFLKDVEAQTEKVSLANDEARINGTAELRSEWGGEFQGNMNAIQSLFTSAPEGTMDALLASAGPDVLKFANSPDNIRWLVGLAKELNPTATLVPPGPDQAGSIDAEIDKISKLMNHPDKAESNKYWKDDKMQQRFMQLNKAKQA